MKIAILTTRTLPHIDVCNRLHRSLIQCISMHPGLGDVCHNPIVSDLHEFKIFLEEEPANPPGYEFLYDEERRLFEEKVYRDREFTADIMDFGKTLNIPSALEAITEYEPDLIIVFGTLRLFQEIINIKPDAIINVHSGNPLYYKGLDNDLWACYHKDWKNLVVCLHRVRAKLDTGGILDMRPIQHLLYSNLSSLRVRKASITYTMLLEAIKSFQIKGKFDFKTQESKNSRYYSQMPSILHKTANKHLKNHNNTIKEK